MNEVNIIPNLQMRKQKPVEVNVPIVIQLRNDGTKLTLIMQMYKINLYSLQQLEGFFLWNTDLITTILPIKHCLKYKYRHSFLQGSVWCGLCLFLRVLLDDPTLSFS